ncbi:hypothetical protein GTP91_25305 [Rugamonas sp. FT82W]|uniref:Uncharacterized protein n=1 Tax=Duganella vulcania TaxID=2692166 RepID=A0A845GC83_9BURK|nr:hypothetical protein [Duganella vulcania]MYM90477.1 hypothetical protein [Duganella vulcania]
MKQLSQHIQHCRTNWTSLPRPMKLAYLVLAIGMAGMGFCLMRLPDMDAPVKDVSWWAAANMLSTILAMSSLAGTVRSLNSYHLKVIDLVWVCASAAGVVFAIVQVFVNSADASRASFEHQWAESRHQASQLLELAARQECSSPSLSVAKGCDRLNILATALNSHGHIAITQLDSACPPFPIDLSSAPPSGYGAVRVQGCLAAYHVASVMQHPVMLDKDNAAKWRQNTQIWPLLLMFFMALRVSKSVAEVIWKIK